MWNLKHGTNEKETHRKRMDLWSPREGRGGWGRVEVGMSRYKLLHTGWINKALVYSSGNHIQEPVTNHSEKKQKRIYIYIHICMGLPGWLSGKEPTCQCRRCRFSPWVRKLPRRRKRQHTPVILPGKSHG